MKKVLKWIAIAVLLLVVLPVAVVIAINLFDDKIDPQAAALGEPRASAIPETENGYFAVLAIGAPDGADAAAYARAWIAEARAAAKENRAEKRDDVKRAKRPDMCDAIQKPCLAAVQEAAADWTGKIDAYQEDLARYEKLISSRAYEEILDYPFRLDAHLPNYAPVMAAQRAYLVRAALSVQAGKIEEALSSVERDIAFQRLMLGSSRTLIGKMVTVASYTRDLAFLADLLQSRAAELKPHTARLAEMLKPIAPGALRMDAALESEFGFVKHGLHNPSATGFMGGGGSPMESAALHLFYKPNATLNQYYASHTQIMASLRDPPAVLAAEKDKTAPGFGEWKILHFIDNPVGRILLQVGAPTFRPYALRLHDLDAYNRLVGLGVEIIAADAGLDGAGEIVAKSDARFHDPYTGKPMAWDAGTRQLSFKANEGLVSRKPFNMDKGRLYLRL
ncbi:MAG: hypothetical protein ABL891_10385 [Burkholderiales bacterium]